MLSQQTNISETYFTKKFFILHASMPPIRSIKELSYTWGVVMIKTNADLTKTENSKVWFWLTCCLAVPCPTQTLYLRIGTFVQRLWPSLLVSWLFMPLYNQHSSRATNWPGYRLFKSFLVYRHSCKVLIKKCRLANAWDLHVMCNVYFLLFHNKIEPTVAKKLHYNNF